MDALDTPAEKPSVYFYHIPKTGGTSLRSFLSDQYAAADCCPAIDWIDMARIPHERLAAYRLVYGHFSANLRTILPARFKTFTFLRHPVERTISSLRHTMRDPVFSPLHDKVRGASLRELIYRDDVMGTVRNIQTTLLSFDLPPEEVFARALKAAEEGRRFALGQMRWKSSPSKAIATLDSYDFVGLMEDFPESLRRLCDRFGFTPPKAAPALNRASDSIDYTQELEARDIEHIEAFMADDMIVYAAARQMFQAGPKERNAADPHLSDLPVLGGQPQPIDLGAPFAGSGWHRHETQAGGTVRWSGPATTAEMHLQVDRSRNRLLQLRLWRKQRLDEVEVKVGGEEVPVNRTKDAGTLCVAIELPALPGGGLRPLNLVIDSKFVVTPAEREGGDRRTLGVMLVSAAIA